jgi:glycosyltransferase involved in cell wall biosynthesis
VRLSLIIPARNEIDTIAEVLRRVRSVDVDKEIIVADDCSTDGTREFLRSQGDITLVENARSLGKGMAIRAALARVTGDIVLIQDADLEYDPRDYPRMVEPIVAGRADIVYGTRFAFGRPRMRFAHYVANRVFALTATLLYGVKVSDEATCYKAFRTDVLKSIDLHCRRFEFCPEVTARLLKRGYRYAEVPIHYEARTYAQGKKVGWRDGFECLWTLIKYRVAG